MTLERKGNWGKAKRDVNPSPKKKYDPLNESNHKLNRDNIATALRPICSSSECILFCMRHRVPEIEMNDDSCFHAESTVANHGW